MKIAVTPNSLNDIKELSVAGADVFVLGNEEFANRLTQSFTKSEITEASELVNVLGKELYLNMNLIVHNEHLKSYKEFLRFAKELNVDGIIFGDLGAYMLAREVGVCEKLIYHPETLNTNFYDTDFWFKKGIKGLTISKEISLEDMMEIGQKKKIEVSIIGHGHLTMFHSRRPLVENFFKYKEEDHKEYINNRNLTLVEEIRNERYPIIQDNHGTHIFREKAMESYKEIIELEKVIDVFIIDGIFKDTTYMKEVVKNYRSILNTKSIKLANTISEQYKEDHDSGFLFKKTQYDKF